MTELAPAWQGDWSAQGKAEMTDHGIHFDASHWGSGDAIYQGFHGKLSDIKRLTYTSRYNSDAKNGEGKDAPYLRIFFTNGKDAIYDPSVPGNDKGSLTENVDHTRNVMAGDWRYDDDCGDGMLDSTQENGCGNGDWSHPDGEPGYGWAGESFSTLLADHGDLQVKSIAVTTGNQFDENVEAMLTRMNLNSDEFIFGATGPKGDTGATGAAGATGATGATGAAGATGTAGQNGTNGVNGQDGASGVAAAGVTGRSAAKGSTDATLRTLHAPTLKGMKFVSVRASLRGKRLPVDGRTITVDLRSKAVGNYNVSLLAKYKTKGGKLHVVRIMRNLSVHTA